MTPRGRLARIGRVLAPSPPVTPLRLRTPADVLAMLEAEAARVRADPAAVARARAVAALARVALAAIDAELVVARVAALEAVLNRRNPP